MSEVDDTLQPGLFRDSIDAAFWKFHTQNPKVYSTLVRLATQAKERGVKRIGIRMLWEVMRWEMTMGGVRTNEGDVYKLNDHYTSRYVRLISRQHPELGELFETRKLRSP